MKKLIIFRPFWLTFVLYDDRREWLSSEYLLTASGCVGAEEDVVIHRVTARIPNVDGNANGSIRGHGVQLPTFAGQVLLRREQTLCHHIAIQVGKGEGNGGKGLLEVGPVNDHGIDHQLRAIIRIGPHHQFPALDGFHIDQRFEFAAGQFTAFLLEGAQLGDGRQSIELEPGYLGDQNTDQTQYNHAPHDRTDATSTGIDSNRLPA